ncbi:MAG: T9SS type A sorting domain-containing protein [Bacteroidota bacterium]
MKNIFLLWGAYLLLLSPVFAQPSFPNLTLSFGEEFLAVTHDPTSITSGPSGANVSWDYTNIDTGVVTIAQILDPTTITGSNLFPDANFAVRGRSISGIPSPNSTFYNFGGDTFAVRGMIRRQTNPFTNLTEEIVFDYSDPEVILYLDINYQETRSDSFTVTYTSDGSTYLREGVDSITYDAYGDITLPFGTFSNAVRIKRVQDYRDFLTLGSTQTEYATYYSETHYWYAANQFQPIFSVGFLEIRLFGGSPTITKFVASADPNFVSNDQVVVQDLSLFPQPASDVLNLSFDMEQAGPVQISIFNMKGKKVVTLYEAASAGGLQSLRLDLPELSAGLYLVGIEVNGKIQLEKLQIK